MARNAVSLVLLGVISTAIAQLLPDAVSDGACTAVPPAANFTTACLQQIIQPQVYSVYIGSNSLYRRYARALLGRYAKDQEELDQLCLKIGFIEAIAAQTGYVNRTNMLGVVLGALHPNTLLPTAGPACGTCTEPITLAQSPGADNSQSNNTMDTFAWCDGVKHMLLVRCINGVQQDYKFLSVGDPDPWALDLVKTKIAELGMDPSHVVQYKSQSQGGTCPPVDDVVTYFTNAFINVGLPLPQALTQGTLAQFTSGIGSVLNAMLTPAYKVIHQIFTRVQQSGLTATDYICSFTAKLVPVLKKLL